LVDRSEIRLEIRLGAGLVDGVAGLGHASVVVRIVGAWIRKARRRQQERPHRGQQR
jgi:hypothetical protein